MNIIVKEGALGETIKLYRQIAGMTLRQIEDATGISNAYLSQLENGKIKKPSADVLHKLSKLLNVNIETFLFAAGIIKEKPKTNSNLLADIVKAYDLTELEQEKLLEYLKFLRWNK